MLTANDITENLHIKAWRLNNIYYIVDKKGDSVLFRPNSIQKKVLECTHRRRLILKARQVGLSTLSVIDILDDTIFTGNAASGIVSYSLEHAQHIFKRIIGHALDNFDPLLKPYLNINSRSAREISFGNGSFLRVDTTLRGSTYGNVLVSEFGKTCARSPQKAEEVITGTLNTVPIDGKIIIESTGEGMDGYFADMCLEAEQRKDAVLSPLDYQLLFYPWYEEPGYQLKERIDYDTSLTDYFNEIGRTKGIQITQQQRNWYAMQVKLLGDKVKQEFPSTVQEAFMSRSDAYYFAAYIERAWAENRCLYTSLYDALQPVYVAMDIGVNHLTVIIFFQVVHGEIRIIDYYEDNNKDSGFYAKLLLQDKGYTYHTIFLPHDSVKRDPTDIVNSVEKDFRRLFAATNTKFTVLPRTNKQELISFAKNRFNRCVFNVSKVKNLLDHVSKYKKQWHEPTGQYLEKPTDDAQADYADALQYALQASGMVERGANTSDALEKHRIAVDKRRKLI
jgi:hypothetical protein